MYRTFSEMPVWKNSHQLSVEVFDITINLPRSEDYGLTSQIRRASNSVSANIAEGFGRRSKRDKSHFYTIARGSAFETQNHILYGHKVGFFQDEASERLLSEYSKLIHELNKIINSLS